MKKKSGIVAVAAALVFVAAGAQAKDVVVKSDTGMYAGKAPDAAAKALLDAAMSQTEGGSWERIGIARVLYLAGRKSDAQAIFDQVLAGKHDAGDVYRIARVYAEARDWSRAKPMFEQFVAMGDYDEKELSEIGAYYLLNGDRATAESYFQKSIQRDPKNTWASMRMAGAYLGVAPQP